MPLWPSWKNEEQTCLQSVPAKRDWVVPAKGDFAALSLPAYRCHMILCPITILLPVSLQPFCPFHFFLPVFSHYDHFIPSWTRGNNGGQGKLTKHINYVQIIFVSLKVEKEPFLIFLFAVGSYVDSLGLSPGSRSVVLRPAASSSRGNLLEMHIPWL